MVRTLQKAHREIRLREIRTDYHSAKIWIIINREIQEERILIDREIQGREITVDWENQVYKWQK
jgi:hypothetical protein